jgi:hypothetical protein
MEWLGLQLFSGLPTTGQIILDCRHKPTWCCSPLSWPVPPASPPWTWPSGKAIAKTACPPAMANTGRLLPGRWHLGDALHQHAGLPGTWTFTTTRLDRPVLLIALLAAWLAMNSLDRAEMRPRHYLQTALLIGLGISTMHYVGMAALQTSAQQHYQSALLLASIAIAVATSLVALLMARHFRQAAAPGTC